MRAAPASRLPLGMLEKVGVISTGSKSALKGSGKKVKGRVSDAMIDGIVIWIELLSAKSAFN
jgi:hypothetical protein